MKTRQHHTPYVDSEQAFVDELNELDREVARLNAEMAEIAARNAALEASLAERNEQVAALAQRLAEQERQAGAQSRKLEEGVARDKSWEALLALRERQLGALHTEIDSASGRAEAAEAALATQHAETLRLSQWASAIAAGPLHDAARKYSLDRGADRDVFVFAVIDGHLRTQRPQHLARAFARAGRRVFFFSNHFVDAGEPGYEIEQLDDSLPLYNVRLNVRGAPSVCLDPPPPEAQAMLDASLSRLLLDFAALSTVSIIEHAYWHPLVRHLPNTYRIYDCMDYHEGYGSVPAKVVESEEDLLLKADLVVVTSAWLENFVRDFNPSVAVVRNASDFDHFANSPPEVYVDPKGRKIIGYYGAIAEWFDLDLIRAVALANPQHLVLLVGDDSIGAGQALEGLPNVSFTGEVPYAQLPYYLHAFDVCVLPFKVLPHTLATNQEKVYEYLSAGKPLVSVDLPEIAQLGVLVWRATSTEQFVQMVDRALRPEEDADEAAGARKAFASLQTWDRRVSQLISAMGEISMPKLSVIVLTCNHLALTKACLQSLLDRTDYPNLEIIVVDNASADGTGGYLEEFGRRNPGTKVILNEENIGFAAANNVGLAAASGDYLVLLNNDTVVTRGWAMTMMRHLQDDASIGLIGPATNNLGNEARIDTGYQDVSDMPVEALRHTIANMGRVSPIRTAAFFCAMFPRSTYERCGPLREGYGLGLFEDDDYCRRIEAAGLRIACAEDVFVHHQLSASFGTLARGDRRDLFDSWMPHRHR